MTKTNHTYQDPSTSPGSNLLTNIKIMSKIPKKRTLLGRRPKPLTEKIADSLVKKSEENEKLRQKTIKTDFFKLFNSNEDKNEI